MDCLFRQTGKRLSYKEPEWMSEFRGHVGDGAVVIVNPHNDLDFYVLIIYPHME